MLTVMLHTLYLVGFKKQAVDLAVKWYSTEPFKSKKSNAGEIFISWQKKYEVCSYCTWPIYRNDPHAYCDEQLRLDLESYEADWQQFVQDEEAKMAQQRLEDEAWIDEVDDYNDDDDICDGICGQPAYACTCTETESFRRHQSDPATAGSWWVA